MSDGRSSIPLLEFDAELPAFIEPGEQITRRDVPAACVVTFFGDSVDRLLNDGGARVIEENRWEDGPHRLLEVEHEGQRLAVLHSGWEHHWLALSWKRPSQWVVERSSPAVERECCKRTLPLVT